MNRGARTRAEKDKATMNADPSSTSKQTAAVAEQGATTAPEKATTSKEATAKTKTSKANRNAKKAAPKATSKASKPAKKSAKATTKAARKTSAAGRANSKKTAVLDLLRRKDGATMSEIAKATGWQNHSIRGFISGTVGKRMGLAVESAKNAAGERTYRITGR
jgi:hypothetical protein